MAKQAVETLHQVLDANMLRIKNLHANIYEVNQPKMHNPMAFTYQIDDHKNDELEKQIAEIEQKHDFSEAEAEIMRVGKYLELLKSTIEELTDVVTSQTVSNPREDAQKWLPISLLPNFVIENLEL